MDAGSVTERAATEAAVSRGGWLRTLCVAIAVAAAFADSSIVVLALPDMFTAFAGATPFKLALVVIAYNAVVAGVALLVFPRLRHPRAGRSARVGSLVFTAAAIGCGVVGSLWGLIAIRSVQGLGAGLLLVSSLALLVGLAGSSQRGAALWSAAGTFGAAFGPALGGILTQLFGWQGIFFGLAALLGISFLALLGVQEPEAEPAVAEPASKRSGALSICEVLVFGALVGTLFLAVTMLITGWGYEPIVGAAIVTILPLLTIAASWFAKRLPGPETALAGAVLLTLGLLGLAFLPSLSLWTVAVALAICGLGVGLTVPFLTDSALREDMGARNVARTIGWRHVGVVVGLVVVGLVLLVSVEAKEDDYPAVAVAGVLGAPIPVDEKLTFGGNVVQAYKEVNTGETPDVSALTGGLSQEDAQALEDSVLDSVRPVVTRTLRWPYLSAAVLALLMILPLLRLRRRSREPRKRSAAAALAGLAAAGVVGLGLLVYEFADGAAGYGGGGIAEACSTEPSYPGSGIAAEAQRVIEEALYATACALAEPLSTVVDALSGTSPSQVKQEVQSTFQQELSSLTAGLPPAVTNAIDQALQGTPLAPGSAGS